MEKQQWEIDRHEEIKRELRIVCKRLGELKTELDKAPKDHALLRENVKARLTRGLWMTELEHSGMNYDDIKNLKAELEVSENKAA